MGPTLAISVFVMLLAALTLVPAVVVVLVGRHIAPPTLHEDFHRELPVLVQGQQVEVRGQDLDLRVVLEVGGLDLTALLRAEVEGRFVDAVGENNFGYHNRAANAHENFSWLRTFVADHYVLAADIDTSRVYIRRDRWAETHP